MQTFHGAVEQVLPYLAARGLDAARAAQFRLGFVADERPGFEQMRGRLSIPFLTPAGPVDVRFRCVRDHDCKEAGCPKYLGLPGRETPLFNVMALQSAGDVIAVTEGELDAVTLQAHAGLPAVGVPGAEAWKPHYGRCLADYEKVLVFCDGDKAGRSLGRTVVREIPSATVINLPEGEDVNSMFLKEGPDGLLRRAGL